jgi:thiol-disulfide isomerase/thioredoxin
MTHRSIINFIILFVVFSVISITKCLGQNKVIPTSWAGIQKRIHNTQDSILIINFWATWCRPCVAELPHFQRLQQETKDQKIQIWLVSLDEIKELKTVVVPFVKKKKLTPKIFILTDRDQNELISQIDANWMGAIPSTLIINTNTKQRVFIQEELNYNTLKSSLEDFINKN